VLALEVCGVRCCWPAHATPVGAFLNVCRHRGARWSRAGTVCRKQSLACPYHGWTYRLDGSLAGIPRAEAFPALDNHLLGLRALPLGCGTASSGSCSILTRKCPTWRSGRRDRRRLAAIGLGGHKFYRQHAVQRASNWKLVVDASSRSIT